MKNYLLGAICLAVVAVILTLGLWPFRAPRNGVTWLAGRNGIRLKGYSTVLSSGALRMPHDAPGATIEVWLRPEGMRNTGTILAVGQPGNRFAFAVRQARGALGIRTAAPDGRQQDRFLANVFRGVRPPTFLTIATGARNTTLYVDGVPVGKRLPFSPADLSGQLILGDSPGQTNTWAGQILRLAIHARELGAGEILDRYRAWRRGDAAAIARQGALALYLFDERSGSAVRDHGLSGLSLDIPPRYQVIDKIALEPFWREYRRTAGYWDSAFKNVIGFVPVGFSFYACFRRYLRDRRAIAATVAWGLALSLTIEILQAFLPTRESGTTDLFTNTFGTWLGVMVFRLTAPVVHRWFPWSPFHSGAAGPKR